MIVGIGMDVVSIARIRNAMKNARFVERILTPSEREARLTPQYVAGRWAAKEALAKAIPGLRSWHAVEVINGASGAPCVAFRDRSFAGYKVHVSITHERELAAAMVVVESSQ